MQPSRVIHIVSCHAEGEVGDVIVGGVAPPPGETPWEQSRYIATLWNCSARHGFALYTARVRPPSMRRFWPVM